MVDWHSDWSMLPIGSDSVKTHMWLPLLTSIMATVKKRKVDAANRSYWEKKAKAKSRWVVRTNVFNMGKVDAQSLVKFTSWNGVTRGSGWKLSLRIGTALQEAVTSSVVAKTWPVISNKLPHACTMVHYVLTIHTDSQIVAESANWGRKVNIGMGPSASVLLHLFQSFFI